MAIRERKITAARLRPRRGGAEFMRAAPVSDGRKGALVGAKALIPKPLAYSVSSFVTQRHQRIDPGRAAGGDEAGGQRGGENQHGNGGEGRRIRRRRLKQKRGQHTCGGGG